MNKIPKQKVYCEHVGVYQQKSISARMEQFFLDNVGKVVTREQLIQVATDPVTGRQPENWHQRLSELRTDKGYTILSARDWKLLSGSEYVLASAEKRKKASKRVVPTRECWKAVLKRCGNRCEWEEDISRCNLEDGAIDPIGGGTVKLTPDHLTPHSVDPNSDPGDPSHWQALCGRHQVTKKNYWNSQTGKINVLAILQSVSESQKREALEFLLAYYGKKIADE